MSDLKQLSLVCIMELTMSSALRLQNIVKLLLDF